MEAVISVDILFTNNEAAVFSSELIGNEFIRSFRVFIPKHFIQWKSFT